MRSELECLAGFPSDIFNPDPDELASLIYGRIDEMEYNFVERTITITGRDLTAAFIDARMLLEFANKKATHIDDESLAAGECRKQVPLTTIRCHAPHVVGGPQTGSVAEISFSRNQTVAKGITVTVQAAGVYNETVKKSYPIAARAISPGKSAPFGATTDYYYMPGGTSLDKLTIQAEALYNQIISHEMKMRVRMPADVITSPHTTIQVKGTGTAFDQKYFSKSVTREMTFEGGFTMDIDAQNTSPSLAPAESLDNKPNIPPVEVTALKLGFGAGDTVNTAADKSTNEPADETVGSDSDGDSDG